MVTGGQREGYGGLRRGKTQTESLTLPQLEVTKTIRLRLR